MHISAIETETELGYSVLW